LIAFKPEQVQNKRLLLCFFDFQQRPSRNMILQMARQAGSLVQQDIVMAAVQASQIESDKLQAWAKDNNLPFPVGSITGNIETIRTAWGVKALPWLILTDRNHIVTAEGFGLDELGKKLELIRETD
jgi:hypothetical protein